MSTTEAVRPADIAPPVAPVDVQAPIQWRWPITTILMSLATLLMALGATGTSTFAMAGATPWFTIDNIVVPARAFILVMTVGAIAATALVTWRALSRKHVPMWAVGVAGVLFLLGFLTWVVADTGSTMPVVRLLAGALAFTVLLVFGSLSGVVCERSGIITSIEAQMLFGAFRRGVRVHLGSPWMASIASPIKPARHRCPARPVHDQVPRQPHHRRRRAEHAGARS